MKRIAVQLSFVAALLACMLAGCTNVETPDFDGDVVKEKIIPPGWRPIGLRVGLAPFRSDLEIKPEQTNKSNSKRWVLNPDKDRLNGKDKSLFAQLLEAMQKYRMFELTEAVKGAEPGWTDEQLRAQALAQGLDVYIVPVVKRHDVGHVGANGNYGWNMAMWWMVSPIFTWWVADEDFDAQLQFDLRMYPASTGELARSKRIGPKDPKEAIKRSLNDWQHGFNVFAIYGTPGYFGEQNWVAVGQLLMPLADCRVKKDTLRYLTGEFSGVAQSEDFQESIRRRVGLIVGADVGGRGGAASSRFCGPDSQALAAFFKRADSWPLVKGGVRTLTGPQATRAAVTEALAELTDLARENDDLFLFLSGTGSLTEKGKLALMLPGREVGKADAVPIGEIVEAAIRENPRTLVLFLDCSFLAPGDARCAVNNSLLSVLPKQAEGEMPISLLKGIIDQCERGGTRCILISATHALPWQQDPERALEMEDLGGGLFTAYVLDGLSGNADSNRNGVVTVEELRAYVSPRVREIAELEGTAQNPYFHVHSERKGFALPSIKR